MQVQLVGRQLAGCLEENELVRSEGVWIERVVHHQLLCAHVASSLAEAEHDHHCHLNAAEARKCQNLEAL